MPFFFNFTLNKTFSFSFKSHIQNDSSEIDQFSGTLFLRFSRDLQQRWNWFISCQWSRCPTHISFDVSRSQGHHNEFGSIRSFSQNVTVHVQSRLGSGVSKIVGDNLTVVKNTRAQMRRQVEDFCWTLVQLDGLVEQRKEGLKKWMIS